MIKYNITQDETRFLQLKLRAETLKCENACMKNCNDIKAVFKCGHYQCKLTTITINRCICCGCNEPNEELNKETHNFLVQCEIIDNV